MRFKSKPIGELLVSCVVSAQLLFEKNANFISLCSHDCSILLQNSMKRIGGLSCIFILQNFHLYDNPAFFKATGLFYGSDNLTITRQIGNLLDSDIIIVKLLLGILIFSTF